MSAKDEDRSWEYPIARFRLIGRWILALRNTLAWLVAAVVCASLAHRGSVFLFVMLLAVLAGAVLRVRNWSPLADWTRVRDMIWSPLSREHVYPYIGMIFRKVDGGKLPLGIDESGKKIDLKIAESSGLIMGGLPGSGKTEAIRVLMQPLLNSPDARVYVADGKGGRTYRGIDGVERLVGDDLIEAHELFMELNDGMDERLKMMEVSSFWSEREKHDLPLLFVVIDEADQYFNSDGRTRDEKELVAKIQVLVSRLVKMGREAGVFTVLATQKPTTDAIPSRIRDSAGLRMAFRVRTAEAEKAIFGHSDDRRPSPMDIPADEPGHAVIESDRGIASKVRVYRTEL